MKYLKSFKFWASILIFTYTIIGFIVIPWFLVNKTPQIIKNAVGINLSIGKASFNPYSFELSLDDIIIKDLDLKPALKFEKIYLNYTVLGLFEKTILFHSLEITTPKLYVRIEENDKMNLLNIMPSIPDDKNTTASVSLSLPTIVLERLKIQNGSAEFLDVRGEPFKLDLGPYSFQAYDISTRKGDLNSHNFTTTINGDGYISLNGGMSLSALKLYGHIDIKNFDLPSTYTYLLPQLRAMLDTGKLTLSLPYQIDLSQGIRVNIDNAKITLHNISLLNNSQEMIHVPNLELNGFFLKWPQQDIVIDNVSIDNLEMATVLEKNGDINLLRAFEKSTQTKKEEEAKNNSITPWTFLLKNADINNASLSFMNASLEKPLLSTLDELSLHVEHISSNTTQPIEYKIASRVNKDSHLDSRGSFISASSFLSADIAISKLNINDFTNYIDPFINFKIKSGTVNAKAQVSVDFEKELNINVQADTDINTFTLHNADDKNLINWKQLKVEGIQYEHHPMSLDIKKIILDEPNIRAHIAKDHSTNFSNLLVESKNEKVETTESVAPKIKIGPIKLINGSTEFTDLSLPFPFKTNIHDLNGNISTLDFSATTPSIAVLNGEIDKYGYADIKGNLTPLAIKENSTITVLLKNLDLNSLTPYSGKFVGYKIESGKLTMDLKYNIKNPLLEGANKINIDSLTLGESVESVDAVSLPLGLAIALLKDSNGQIDIDLPVSGDMNNPDFSYGGVIWRAVGNMITGIVTAPFRFLGSLLGIDGDALKSIDFDKGSFEVISTEHEKLSNLQKILGKRPAIKIKITGAYDDVYDLEEFQIQDLSSIIKEELATLKPDTNSTQNDNYGIALKNLYIKSFALAKYEALKQSFMLVEKKEENASTRSKKTQLSLDILAFNSQMRHELRTTIKIAPERLVTLGDKRAERIKEELVKTYGIDISRITILPSVPKSAKKDRWIEADLEIAI